MHTGTAQILARYISGPFVGKPAITSRTLASGGRAVYVSAGLDANGVDALARLAVASQAAIDLPDDVEVAVRQSDEEDFTFLINHGVVDVHLPADGTEMLTGEDVRGLMPLPAGEVRVLRQPRGGSLYGSGSQSRSPSGRNDSSV